MCCGVLALSSSQPPAHHPGPHPPHPTPLHRAVPPPQTTHAQRPPRPPPTITKSSDRAAFERLLRERLDEPLGFLDEGTLQMWRKQAPHVQCLHYTATEGEDGALLGFLTVYEVRQAEGREEEIEPRPRLALLPCSLAHHSH